MISLQLLKNIQTLPAATKNVYAADRIPTILEKPCAIIVNTDNHDSPGQHWCAIFINKQENGFFFDSYGLPPINFYHRTALERNCKKYTWNTKCLQQLKSKVCGQYCVFFLHYMCFGQKKNFISFNNLFTRYKSKNDSMILSFFKKYCKTKKNLKTCHFTYYYNYNNKSVNGKGFCIQSCTSSI